MKSNETTIFKGFIVHYVIFLTYRPDLERFDFHNILRDAFYVKHSETVDEIVETRKRMCRMNTERTSNRDDI